MPMLIRNGNFCVQMFILNTKQKPSPNIFKRKHSYEVDNIHILTLSVIRIRKYAGERRGN